MWLSEFYLYYLSLSLSLLDSIDYIYYIILCYIVYTYTIFYIHYLVLWICSIHVESLWILLDSLGFTWPHLNSLGFTWIHLGSLGLIWKYNILHTKKKPYIYMINHLVNLFSSLIALTCPGLDSLKSLGYIYIYIYIYLFIYLFYLIQMNSSEPRWI